VTVGAKRWYWRPDEDALLRARYDSRTETITDLTRMLRRPRWVVRKRAQELGLARVKELRWSAEEVAYLEANYSRYSIQRLARRMGRTVTAVAVKKKRLGLRKTDEGYTARALAQAFGVDDHKVSGWIRAGLLEATMRGTELERDVYYISDDAALRFVRQNPLAFDLRKVDQLWFLDLVLNGRNGKNEKRPAALEALVDV
jgi:hypothetical protein